MYKKTTDKSRIKPTVRCHVAARMNLYINFPFSLEIISRIILRFAASSANPRCVNTQSNKWHIVNASDPRIPFARGTQ